jgi:hypothetical protein
LIAPGRLLILAEAEAQERTDPAMASFLAFLAQDITRAPHNIPPLDAKLTRRVDKLTKGIVVSPDKDLGDGAMVSHSSQKTA